MARRPAPLPFCDDWACPSLWSCARSWGRSWPYWRFDIEADSAEGVTLYKGPRNPQRASCEDYGRDTPRAWLKGAFDAGPMARPTIPPGFRLLAVPTDIDCDGEC